jgi:hypothetical protein
MLMKLTSHEPYSSRRSALGWAQWISEGDTARCHERRKKLLRMSTKGSVTGKRKPKENLILGNKQFSVDSQTTIRATWGPWVVPQNSSFIYPYCSLKKAVWKVILNAPLTGDLLGLTHLIPPQYPILCVGDS